RRLHHGAGARLPLRQTRLDRLLKKMKEDRRLDSRQPCDENQRVTQPPAPLAAADRLAALGTKGRSILVPAFTSLAL
ncbi:MAG: hypothetical protein MK133_11090, partial [Planctomycetes bacterium]|nr:hypothetical protein [Planctomycetota bacterium]